MELILEILPITLLIGITYLICRIIFIRKSGIAFTFKKEITLFLFVLYVAGLINLTLVPPFLWSQIWFYFETGFWGGFPTLFSGDFSFSSVFISFLKGEYIMGNWVITMLIGNFLMFVPLGIFLPMLSGKVNLKRILLISFFCPLLIELLQPIIGRSFDVDDLILNFLGVLTGYLIFKSKNRSPDGTN